MIRGINDLTNEYDLTTDWGKYLKLQIENSIHKSADLMVYGNDESRNKWFSSDDIAKTAELILPRNTISATMVRGFLVINDKKSWQKVTPTSIHSMYDNIRDELMEVSIYKDIYNKIYNSNMSIDSFMKIYTELEKKDKIEKLKNI